MTGGGLDMSAANALQAALTKETAAALESKSLFIVSSITVISQVWVLCLEEGRIFAFLTDLLFFLAV
jgi:hypothetical protein